MDRREALKKMAAGGVAVAGSTMVLSSRAFGLADPIPPVLPIVNAVINPNNDNRIDVTVTPTQLPTCVPTGSGDPELHVSSFFEVVPTPTRAVVDPVNGANSTVGAHTTVFTITRTQNGNASIAIDFRLGYLCMQGTTSSNLVCSSWILTFAKSGNSWGTAGTPFTPVLTTAPVAACPPA